ncbi:MAG: CBS domain-containing protein [Thermoplasmatota archaeon]|nr:CBS domain-containing protein [Candidatus Thermoplasmatota archaeon]MBU1914079.1 CBS domain-containing protein [Candidatus Thermoplasmatota archaeon]
MFRATEKGQRRDQEDHGTEGPQRRIRDLRIRDVMTKDVVTVTEETSVKMLWSLFKKYDYNAFPVVKGNQLVGIVTKLDFMRIFSPGQSFSRRDFWDMFATNVEDISRKAVVTVWPDDSLEKAVEYMVEFGLRSIPVVDGKTLVGIVSRQDLMEHLIPEHK